MSWKLLALDAEEGCEKDCEAYQSAKDQLELIISSNGGAGNLEKGVAFCDCDVPETGCCRFLVQKVLDS